MMAKESLKMHKPQRQNEWKRRYQQPHIYIWGYDFICSFFVFEICFDDVFGLRFFAVVLNNHLATSNCFPGLCSLDNFAEACPFLYFLMMTSLISVGLVGVWRTVPPPGFCVWTCHSLMQAHTYGTGWAMVNGVFFSTSHKAVLVSLSPPEAMPSLTMVWGVQVGAES